MGSKKKQIRSMNFATTLLSLPDLWGREKRLLLFKSLNKDGPEKNEEKKEAEGELL
jgi:hypothetical protein